MLEHVDVHATHEHTDINHHCFTHQCSGVNNNTHTHSPSFTHSLLHSPGESILGTDAAQSSLHRGVLDGNVVHLKPVLAQTLLALVLHKAHQRGEEGEVADLHLQSSSIGSKLSDRHLKTLE